MTPSPESNSPAPLLDLSIVRDLRNTPHHSGVSLFEHLLGIFLESAGQRLAALKAERRPADLEYLAHALKGISHCLGASRLGGLCHELEVSAASATEDEVRRRIAAAEAAFAETRTELLRFKDGNGPWDHRP